MFGMHTLYLRSVIYRFAFSACFERETINQLRLF